MRIDYTRQFLKSVSRLPANLIAIADEKEALFKTNSFHPSLDTHKLHGKHKDVWAFSMNRKYRIKFIFISSEHVLFIDIGTHDIYR